MKKEEYIRRYGIVAYDKRLQQSRDWNKAHPEYEKKYHEEHKKERNTRSKQWSAEYPEQVKAHHQEANRKGGKRYEQKRAYMMQGLQHERILVRGKHGYLYKQYKKVIDPEGLTQIHHEWLPETANYRGVALVEKEQHRYGVIDVIQILEGEITLFTERK